MASSKNRRGIARLGLTPRFGPVGGVLLLAFTYFVAAKFGLSLSVAHGSATPVWAPTAISLVALFLFGKKLWPGVFIGAFLANLFTPIPHVAAVGIATGNTLEALVGCMLLGRAGFRPSLNRVRDVVVLVGLAAILSTLVSATIGMTTLLATGVTSTATFASHWSIWWVGDMMANLLLAPFLFVWIGGWADRPQGRSIEACILAVSTVASCAAVFWFGVWGYPILLFPLLLWSTLRFGAHGASASILFVSAAALWAILAGSNEFGAGNPTAAVEVFQALAGAVGVSLLMVAATIAERDASAAQSVSILESAPDATIIVDDKGTIVFANPRASEVFGYPDAALQGSALETLLPPESRAAHARNRLGYFADPRTRPMGVGLRLAGRRADGSEFPVDISLSSLETNDGTLAMAFVRDVSERVEAEKQQRESQVRDQVLEQTLQALDREREALVKLQELDDLKTTFLHAVSHDLRTPLTAILGFSRTLERDDVDLSREDQQDLAERITRNAHKLDRLLSDLLDLERLDRGLVEPNRSPTDVGALVRSVIKESDVGEHPLHVNADPVVASVDRAQVERIVENLLVNAVRHTNRGTDIWIRVREEPDGVLIAVEDAGSGVPADARATVFEAFGRTGPVSETPGMGIGLSLVSRFAELHGGRAWVDDRVGGGASFRVFLPNSVGKTRFT